MDCCDLMVIPVIMIKVSQSFHFGSFSWYIGLAIQDQFLIFHSLVLHNIMSLNLKEEW